MTDRPPQLKRSYAFTVVPNDFVKASQLSHEAFRLYVVLSMHAPGGAADNATVFPDYERLKQCTGIRHNHTIASRMRELEAGGWIERRKRFGASTVYTLTIAQAKPSIPSSGDGMDSPSSGALMHGVNHSPSRREPQSVTPSKTNKNQLTRTKKQEQELRAARAPAVNPDPVAVVQAEQIPKASADESKSADAKPQAETRLYGDCFVGVAKACAMDPKVPMLARRISATAKYLAGRGIDPACIERFAAWWSATDWRGKRGDMPTPERIAELWLQFDESRRATTTAQTKPATQQPKPATNGYRSGGNTFRRPMSSFTDEDRARAEAEAAAWLEEEEGA